MKSAIQNANVRPSENATLKPVLERAPMCALKRTHTPAEKRRRVFVKLPPSLIAEAQKRASERGQTFTMFVEIATRANCARK